MALEELCKEQAAIQRAVNAYSILDRGDVPAIVSEAGSSGWALPVR